MKTFSVSVSVNTSPKGEIPEGLVWDFTIEASTAMDAVDRACRNFRLPAAVPYRDAESDPLHGTLKMAGHEGYFASHDDVIPALADR